MTLTLLLHPVSQPTALQSGGESNTTAGIVQSSAEAAVHGGGVVPKVPRDPTGKRLPMLLPDFELNAAPVPSLLTSTKLDDKRFTNLAISRAYANVPRLQTAGTFRVLPNGLLLQPSKAADSYHTLFPHAPLIMLPSGAQRAAFHRQNQSWTGESMKAAMHEFALPMDFLDYNHELVSYHDLVSDPKFHIITNASPPQVETKVMLICPKCLSNKHVSPPTSGRNASEGIVAGKGFSFSDTSRLTTIHGLSHATGVVYGRYCCNYPACRTTAGNAFSFRSCDRDVMGTLPWAVQARYPQLSSCTNEFLDLLFSTDEPWACVQRSLQRLYDGHNARLASAYYAFTHLHSDAAPWPAWEFTDHTAGLFSAPSTDSIVSCFDSGYALIEPHLLGDMLRRSPGRFVSVDGTFRAAGRTVEAAAKVLVFVMGEDHTVCAWWAVETESWDAMAPGMIRLRKRLEKIKVEDPNNPNEMVTALSIVRYFYSDRCCNQGAPCKKLCCCIQMNTMPHHIDGPTLQVWQADFQGHHDPSHPCRNGG